MVNGVFKKMLDKVRFITQKKETNESYFMDDKQAPLFTSESVIIDEPAVSTKSKRSVKINSGSATWSADAQVLESDSIFANGLPKGNTIMVKHFK